MQALQAQTGGAARVCRPAGRRPLQCRASAVAVCPKLVQQARFMAAVGAAWNQSAAGQQRTAQGLRQRIADGASWMAAVAPVAASAASSTAEIYGAVAKAIDIYLLILTVRVILTWFRNINWFNEPFATLRQFTDPFLGVFRGILPSFGGIDVSPMVGFLLLNFCRNQLVHMSRTMI